MAGIVLFVTKFWSNQISPVYLNMYFRFEQMEAEENTSQELSPHQRA